jgi:hypothetical protein
MRWVGRAVALLCLVWLAIVVLGGLGVGPASRLPLGNVLRPSKGPPPLPRSLHPRPPAAADVVPALPPTAVRATPATSNPARAHAAAANHGRSSSAPGHGKLTATTHGNSATAPGQAKTTPTGKSSAAPGHAPKATTTTTNRAGKIHVIGKKP